MFREDLNEALLNEQVNQSTEESYIFSKSCLVYLSYLSFGLVSPPIISLSMGERKRERHRPVEMGVGGWYGRGG